MKNLFLFFFLFSFTAFSQDLSVEKIWKKYEYIAKGVEDFKSMADGNFYTKTNEEGSIFKHSILNSEDKGVCILEGKNLLYNGVKVEYDDFEFNKE